MKKHNNVAVWFITLMLLLSFGCKKEELPPGPVDIDETLSDITLTGAAITGAQFAEEEEEEEFEEEEEEEETEEEEEEEETEEEEEEEEFEEEEEEETEEEEEEEEFEEEEEEETEEDEEEEETEVPNCIPSTGISADDRVTVTPDKVNIGDEVTLTIKEEWVWQKVNQRLEPEGEASIWAESNMQDPEDQDNPAKLHSLAKKWENDCLKKLPRDRTKGHLCWTEKNKKAGTTSDYSYTFTVKDDVKIPPKSKEEAGEKKRGSMVVKCKNEDGEVVKAVVLAGYAPNDDRKWLVKVVPIGKATKPKEELPEAPVGLEIEEEEEEEFEEEEEKEEEEFEEEEEEKEEEEFEEEEEEEFEEEE